MWPSRTGRIRLTRLCSISCFLACGLYTVLPFVTLFPGRAAVFAALLVQQSLLRFALGTTFTCTFTILNNSVPTSARGRMQGLAMTIGSLARAVGPTMGVELFAWSLTNGLGFPWDVHFVFLLLGLLNVVPALIAAGTFTAALDLPVDEATPPAPSDCERRHHSEDVRSTTGTGGRGAGPGGPGGSGASGGLTSEDSAVAPQRSSLSSVELISHTQGTGCQPKLTLSQANGSPHKGA